jgi:alpha-glucosidase
MKKTFFLFNFLFAALFLMQTNAATTYKVKIHDGLNVKIQVCADNIFRLQISKNKEPHESLMERYHIIKTDWADVTSTTKTADDVFSVTTDKYNLQINKKTGVFSVTDKSGKTVLEKLLFHTGDDPLCEKLGNVINEKYLSLHVAKNNGIIGDDTKKYSVFDKVETGDFKNNSIISIALKKGECFYGGGSTSREHINHRGELLRMWSTYAHTENPQPFMLSSNGWAIYNNDTRKQFFDVGSYNPDEFSIYNTYNEADFFLMFDNDMAKLINHYTLVTGRPYLLPRYAYGLCFGPNMREDQFNILRDAVELRNNDFPCDLLWLEPQWMEKRYDFSMDKKWNYQLFSPEPYWLQNKYPKEEYSQLFIGRLHEMGFHLGLWLCINYDHSVTEEDALAKAAGKPESGRPHWMDHLKNFIDQGVDGFKLDPARTIDEHPDTTFYNGYTDKEMHNLNQVLMPKELQQMFENHKGIRSWHHYCGGWAGTQHWTAATSGDNGGTITALFDQVNLGLSGFLNSSCDIMGTNDTKIVMQSLHFGMFMPWCQVNSWFSLRLPFYFNKKNQKIYKDYVKLRYALNPYIYSAALEGAQTGMPIVRAMPLVYPDDSNTIDLAYQYMFGPNLLVGAFSNDIYLPKGEWIDFWTGEKLNGGRKITHQYPADRAGLLFIREGAIIPMMKDMNYIGEEPIDTLIMKVYPKGKSSYTLYEDDGTTFKYRNGAIASTRYDCNEQAGKVTFTVQPTTGKYVGMFTARTYVMQIAAAKKPATVTVNGAALKDWQYTTDGKVVLTAHQADVTKPLTVVLR